MDHDPLQRPLDQRTVLQLARGELLFGLDLLGDVERDGDDLVDGAALVAQRHLRDERMRALRAAASVAEEGLALVSFKDFPIDLLEFAVDALAFGLLTFAQFAIDEEEVEIPVLHAETERHRIDDILQEASVVLDGVLRPPEVRQVHVDPVRTRDLALGVALELAVEAHETSLAVAPDQAEVVAEVLTGLVGPLERLARVPPVVGVNQLLRRPAVSDEAFQLVLVFDTEDR